MGKVNAKDESFLERFAGFVGEFARSEYQEELDWAAQAIQTLRDKAASTRTILLDDDREGSERFESFMREIVSDVLDAVTQELWEAGRLPPDDDGALKARLGDAACAKLGIAPGWLGSRGDEFFESLRAGKF